MDHVAYNKALEQIRVKYRDDFQRLFNLDIDQFWNCGFSHSNFSKQLFQLASVGKEQIQARFGMDAAELYFALIDEQASLE
jgi:hypothetical protein